MRIDDAGAGDRIGRTIAQANGMDYKRVSYWTGTCSPDGEMNGIYFTTNKPVAGHYLVLCTAKQYHDYVKEAGIE